MALLTERRKLRVARGVRRWLGGHALNRPSGRTVWRHVWPWLLVAAMFGWAGCWQGVAVPVAFIAVIGALGLRRPPSQLPAHVRGRHRSSGRGARL